MASPHFEAQVMPGWPRLAWVASVTRSEGHIAFRHGSAVETGETWCGEIVWSGDFDEGDFDHADVVMGSGVRLRDDEIVFVPAADNLNQLWTFDDGTTLHVANSLPALLAVAELELLDDPVYTTLIREPRRPLEGPRELPTRQGPVGMVCSDNLHVRGNTAATRPKPEHAPRFEDFASYRDYLFETARRVGENQRAPARAARVDGLANVSRGYDSTAVAVIAREAGVERVATIRHARREPGVLLDTDDSGASTARSLGLAAELHTREHDEYACEDAVWSVAGSVSDVNLALFEYRQPVTLVFGGYMGDRLWNPESELDPASLRWWNRCSGFQFGEARLELGAILCSPVFWGCSRADEILAIGRHPEMQSWTLGSDYDRPIPRRIAEEAGIDGATFGRHKMASTFKRKRGTPLSRSLRPDFARYLRARGQRPVPPWKEALSLGLRAFDGVLLSKLPDRLRFSCGDWIELPEPEDFFRWGNERRRELYRRGLTARTRRS